jgi:asparagine synthase (glutamine-hydrolysing)
MCGIFGILYSDNSFLPDKERLDATEEILDHRGPDAKGNYAASGIGLVHTRLSLLDLNSRSNQPFWDTSRRYCLVYNGEIYNFMQLREELERNGVHFATTSDTEVLLQLLIHAPVEDVLLRLEGMFAFGFYDAQEKMLTIARDRFGIKPLYVYDSDNAFAFGSMVASFRPWLPLSPEPLSIISYLLGYGGPSQSFTFYNNVKLLPSGGIVKIKQGERPTYSRFFTMTDFWDEVEMDRLFSISPAQIVDLIEERLYESVRKHLIADAPVGAFCSGGVDSSVIMAMASKLHNNLAIFHANVVGKWSELDAASRLARHLNLDLKHVDVNEQDFVDLMPDVMRVYEHPFTYHPNCVPFMMVSRLVREHGIKGMLSGEGSDECFLGYPWLGREKIVSGYYKIGRCLRSLIHAIPNLGRIVWPHEGNSKEVVTSLLNRFEMDDERREAREVADIFEPKRIPQGNIRSIDYLNYHLRTLLHRNDCMGMEASIEARFPFLDQDLVRTAVNMPYKYKIRFSPTVFEKAHPFVRDKWVVRKIAERYLPPELSNRIKIGFWTTALQRMHVDPEYFSQSFIPEFFQLTSRQTKHLFEKANQDLTMRLLHLDVWAHVCLKGEPTDSLVRKLCQYVSISPERNWQTTSVKVP